MNSDLDRLCPSRYCFLSCGESYRLHCILFTLLLDNLLTDANNMQTIPVTIAEPKLREPVGILKCCYWRLNAEGRESHND